MKYVITLMLIQSLALSSNAQMNTLFYGSDWGNVKSFTDSIYRVLPGFKIKDTLVSKNGKEQTLLFIDSLGKHVLVSFLRLKNNHSDKIGTIQIRGDFTNLLMIYRKFILGASNLDQDHPDDCWPVIVKTIPDGKMPISFCRQGNYWIISNKIPL